MNCPNCGSAISTPVRGCKTCRLDFGEELYDKFAFYHTWKDELEKLTELQNSLFAAIANVSAKMRRYEDVLNRDLALRAVSESPKRNKVARKKSKRR